MKDAADNDGPNKGIGLGGDVDVDREPVDALMESRLFDPIALIGLGASWELVPGFWPLSGEANKLGFESDLGFENFETDGIELIIVYFVLFIKA